MFWFGLVIQELCSSGYLISVLICLANLSKEIPHKENNRSAEVKLEECSLLLRREGFQRFSRPDRTMIFLPDDDDDDDDDGGGGGGGDSDDD